MGEYLLLILATALVNNVLLVKFLGLCSFMGVSSRLDSALGMSLATTFVLTLTSTCTHLVFRYVLAPLGLAITMATARSRWRWLPLPVLVLLPLLIEPAQASSLVGRTCDITDVLDNWTGAGIGTALALVLPAISRRRKRGGRQRSGPP